MSWYKRIVAFFVALLIISGCGAISFAYNIGDDYPDKYSDISSYHPTRLFYYRQCTDFAAWCLISRNGVSDFSNWYGGIRWGNAKEWRYTAESLGISCNSTPAVGAIACWSDPNRRYDSNYYGHVAWVEAVNGSSVIIEEYNNTPYAYSRRDISSDPPTCYIHIADIQVNGILDVNGRLDGNDVGNTSGYGTFDIYINGSIAGDDVSDYYNAALPAGTSYSIADIKATTGHIYNGSIGNISGSIASGNTVDVRLKFDTCTNHSYGAGVVTKEATCTEPGVKTFTCTKCGSTKTEIIPKLAHTPVVDPAVPATVTKTGLTEGSHCSVCGTVIIAQQVVPKLPRVPYDFDMDGVAEPVMTLPGALKNIEASAFEGGTAKVVIIPDGTTTIGSRAFADMPSLIAVFIPESVTTISFDVFEGSPNVKLYVAKGSRWGARLNLPAVEIENGWVLADNVPMGAEITDRKWTYTTREYKESSSASYPGWTKYKTQKTWSAWSGWQNSEISASSDREVRTQTIVTGYNMISYCVSGPNGRSYQPSPTYTVRLQHGPYWWSKAELDSARVFYAGSYFDYESNVAGYVLDGTAYCKWDGSDTGGYIPMFIQETFYGTQWSYRDAAYTYFYYRDFNGESATDPSGQDNVSNVQEWVKYSY